MKNVLSRRVLLSAVSIGALSLMLAACNEKKAEAPAEPKAVASAEAPAAEAAKPATEAAPAVAEAPKSQAAPIAAEAPKTEVAVAEVPKTEPAKAVELPKSDGDYDMAKVLEPGTLKDIFIGNADAKVTIVEYASMTCPHCASFHEATLPAIKEKYIDTGKARIVMREFPFDPRAAAAFMLARCAGDDKYNAMVSTLFKQQDTWSRAEDAKAALLQLSKLAGFSQESFEACLTNQQLLNDVNAVRERGAKDFGVESTPTFIINGKKYSGALTVDQMSGLIDSLL